MPVDDLLAAYDQAFAAYDLDRITVCFASPCVFVSETASGDPVVLPSDPAHSRARVERILGWHRQLGVVRLRPEPRWRLDLSPKQVCTHLFVTAEDRDGAALYTFDGVYTFAQIDGQWRIAAINHNQIPALLARLGAAPAQGF